MKRWIALLLSIALLLTAAGCGGEEAQETGFLTTTTNTTTTTIASAATTTTTTTVTTTTATGAITTRPSTSRTKTICPTRPPVTTTTTAPIAPPIVDTLTKWELPQVVRQTEGYIGEYTDMTYTADGRIIAIGEVYDADLNPKTVIDVYGNDLALLETYECDVWYSDIATSQDGGTILARGIGACTVEKLSPDFKVEWSVEFEHYAFDVFITSLVTLSDGTVGIVYAKPFDGTWNLLWVSKDGKQFHTQSFGQYDAQNGLAYGVKLVADNNGGFYLFQTVTADTHPVCEADKGYEVLASHYVSENDAWNLDSFTVVGGVSDEWCNDAAVDDEGNYYIALSSSDTVSDPFWDEVLPAGYGYMRRMLVKVSPTGEILYRVPLSGRGMAVDQVTGIHIRDGRVYVGGLSVFYDGVIDPNVADSGNDYPDDLYVAYAVCADAEGKILSRRVFRYNNMERGAPRDSLWLSDGRMVLCGAVTMNDSDFDLEFEPEYADGTPADRALFVYAPLPDE